MSLDKVTIFWSPRVFLGAFVQQTVLSKKARILNSGMSKIPPTKLLVLRWQDISYMSMNRPQPCVRNAMSAKTTFRTNSRCRVRIASVLLNCDELWKKSLKSCFHDQQTNLSHHEVRARCGEHI